MTGDLVTAQDADRLGLVNHVVPRRVADGRGDGDGHAGSPRVPRWRSGSTSAW